MTDTPLTAEAVAEMRALEGEPHRFIGVGVHSSTCPRCKLDRLMDVYLPALLTLAERSLAPPPSSNAEVAREIVGDIIACRITWQRARDRITAALDAKEREPSAGMQRVIDEVNADIRACFKDREPAKAPVAQPSSRDYPSAYSDPGPTITTDNTSPVAQPAERTVRKIVKDIVDEHERRHNVMSGHYWRELIDTFTSALCAERERTKAAVDEGREYIADLASTIKLQKADIAALERRCAELEAASTKMLDALQTMVAPISHAKGCLFRNDRLMPCQCGFNDRVSNAFKKAKTVIAETSDFVSSGTPHLDRLLADARREGGWQTIDTAPKMKVIILFAVTDVSDTGEVRNWKMETGCWSTGYEGDPDYSPWDWGGRQLKKYEVQPTYWHSLPLPPQEG